MVIANPRSGTTWAANWLTTDTTHCLHDPLARHAREDLDRIVSAKRLGIACTAIGIDPPWLNAHPARKVILHRSSNEIRASLEALGLMGYRHADLHDIQGMHCGWRELLEQPQAIYEFLTDRPFDPERHEELRQMNIQAAFERVVVDKNAVQSYVARINKCLH